MADLVVCHFKVVNFFKLNLQQGGWTNVIADLKLA